MCRWRFGVFLLALSLCASAEPYRQDRILIKPKAGARARDLAGFHVSQRNAATQVGEIQVVRVERQDIQRAIAAYQRSGLVEFAEPDYWVQLAVTHPNDPGYVDGTLWALNNTGQFGWVPDADIDAPEAWDFMTSASNIVVALVDTGVRYAHEDLAANMWRHPLDGSHGINVLNGSNDPADDSGHGTHIAGIVGGVGNNSKGVPGVAWQVQMMACKFADATGGSVSDAIACIDYARTNGARIINASWGSYEFSLALSNAIYEARVADILVVAAAGNDALDVDDPNWNFFPATLPLDNIVSVTASNPRDQLYYLSNIGATNVDLAAPGESIASTSHRADDAYGSSDGTSMAAAYVSGACALLRARFPNETAPQIIHRLLAGTDPLAVLAGKCLSGGRLNLRRALGPVPARLAVIETVPFRLLVSGDPQRTYVIEAATNLANWSPVYTNVTAADGTFIFDESSGANGYRFYRARSVP